MKKIVYILDTFDTGGAEKSLLDIAIQNKEATSYFITIYRGNQLAELAAKNGITVFQLNNDEKYGFSKAVQQLIPIIKEIQPDVKILVFSAREEELYALRYLKAGADGYLNKLSSDFELKEEEKKEIK